MANRKKPAPRPPAAFYFPGVALAAVVALHAWLLDFGGFGSGLLYALVFGMLLHPLTKKSAALPGIEFSAKHLLAIAVALLGARLTLADVLAIGIAPALAVIAAIVCTIVFSVLAARAMGLTVPLGLLAGGSTAFCGASAAVAIASVLPKKGSTQRDAIFVIVGVIALSAIAMVIYPLVAVYAGLEATRAGIFLGGSIHNVPQAVAAGFTISEAAGNTATLTKLFRVSLIAFFVLGIAFAYGQQKRTAGSRIDLPWFILAFAALVVIGSFGWIPAPLKTALSFVSTALMLVAMSAIGMMTSLEAIWSVGTKVLLLLVLNSLVLVTIMFAVTFFGLV